MFDPSMRFGVLRLPVYQTPHQAAICRYVQTIVGLADQYGDLPRCTTQSGKQLTVREL
jgi:hypothetical protein